MGPGPASARWALARMTTEEGHSKSSSHPLSRPSSVHQDTLRMKEGAGKAGYPLIPMVRVQQKSTRQNHRISQISGLPAQWLYGLYVIFPGTGLIAPVIPALVNSAGIWHQHRAARTTRFHRAYRAVRRREIRAATRHAHRIPRSTSVTIAKRPSGKAGWGRIAHDSEKRKRNL